MIRDNKTGDFLQFKNEDNCIHVRMLTSRWNSYMHVYIDFGQSLVKVKGIGKRFESEDS